jgi:hypothetical protein
MRKIYRPLTVDQKKRGVIFSSTLSYNTTDKVGRRHEVTATDEDKRATIDRLLDDKFFNGSDWKYNVIRRG